MTSSPARPSSRTSPPPSARDRCSGERWLVAGAAIGNYELIAQLGRGAGGAVWRARHVFLRSEVALKLLAPDAALGALSTHAEGALRQRFTREAQVGAALGATTDRVVRAVDAGEHEGVPWLAMELCEGPSLEEVVAGRGRLDPGEVLALAQQLGRALDALHAAGFVHRDVKPANVVCVSVAPFDVKLTDFGVVGCSGELPVHIAAFDTRATVAGALIGSPMYMSPEQVRGEATGARSDLWSLGVTLYEALLGVVPFDGESLATIVRAVSVAHPVAPTARRPTLPRAIDAFFARALARDPAARFASGSELAGALERALTAAATTPPPARRPGSVVGAALLALGLAGVTWWTAGPAIGASAAACRADHRAAREMDDPGPARGVASPGRAVARPTTSSAAAAAAGSAPARAPRPADARASPSAARSRATGPTGRLATPPTGRPATPPPAGAARPRPGREVHPRELEPQLAPELPHDPSAVF